MIFILGVKNDGTNFQSRNHRAKLFVGLHLDERQQAFASPGIEADLIFLAHKVHLRPKQFDPKSFSCEGCNTIPKDRITYLDLLKKYILYGTFTSSRRLSSKVWKTNIDQTLNMLGSPGQDLPSMGLGASCPLPYEKEGVPRQTHCGPHP